MRLTFDGNLGVILGGSSLLGLALAKSMLNSGITPVLTYRSDASKHKIEKALSPVSSGFKTLLLDFSSRDTLKNISPKILGSPDFLIDFAQSDYERLVSSARVDDIYTYFEENISFRAAVLIQISRLMLKCKKGRCVFVSSTAASQPNPGQGFYAAAKMASEALYRSMGLELGCRGITSVILRPGYVDAGRGKNFLSTHANETLPKIPVGHPVLPEKIADTILFLLSESAGSFNATEICIDGGLTAGKQS
jgi:3-oxoacyl-[acyl-carrier protein] reductase